MPGRQCGPEIDSFEGDGCRPVVVLRVGKEEGHLFAKVGADVIDRGGAGEEGPGQRTHLDPVLLEPSARLRMVQRDDGINDVVLTQIDPVALERLLAAEPALPPVPAHSQQKLHTPSTLTRGAHA